MIGVRQYALERPGSLAESTCVGVGDIQDYQVISRRRGVPINESIVPGVGFSSCEHCGRKRAVILAKDLEYLTQTDYDKYESESESVSRMLNALVSVLRKRGKRQRVVIGVRGSGGYEDASSANRSRR